MQSLLYQTIYDRGNTKLSHSLPIRLWYLYPPDWFRFVAA